jgi:uncharacterized iron-regulated protein
MNTPAMPPHKRGTWIAPATGRVVAQADILAEAAKAQAVLLGETHDIAEIHRWQLHVTVALHVLQPDLAVGFEMFPRRVQPVLDEWVAGKLDTEQFLVRVEWSDVWGFDPELYLPLFHFCRQQSVPMLALNCERGLLRRVRTEGWPAIPEAERDGVSPSKPATEAYRQYLGSLMNSIAAAGTPAPAREISDGFVAAQQVWDRAFACNIANALKNGTASLVVGIIGRGHLEFGHGTPYQLRDLGIERISILLPSGPDDSERNVAPGIADAVFKLDQPEGRQPRGFKLGIAWVPDTLQVAEVAADSLAESIGLVADDRICAIAGKDVFDLAGFGAVLRRAQAGSCLPIVVERQRVRKAINFQVPYVKPFGA